MHKIIKEISSIFATLMFGNSPRCSVLRGIAALVLAILVVFDPFTAAQWFRIYLYLFCSGTLLLVFSHFKMERKSAILFILVFAAGIAFLYYGRGDSVSGMGIALFLLTTGTTLLRSCTKRLDRYNKLIRISGGVCAFFVALVIIARCSQLGVRYLDQLHSYALALAGCGFANFMMIKRGDI